MRKAKMVNIDGNDFYVVAKHEEADLMNASCILHVATHIKNYLPYGMVILKSDADAISADKKVGGEILDLLLMKAFYEKAISAIQEDGIKKNIRLANKLQKKGIGNTVLPVSYPVS